MEELITITIESDKIIPKIQERSTSEKGDYQISEEGFGKIREI